MMAEPKTFPRWLGLTIALAVGTLMAVQVRINGELGQRLGDGYTAAALSFGSGLVLCSLALLFAQPARAGLRLVWGRLRGGEMPWWTALGGIGGAFFVLSQSLVGSLIGIAMFSVAVVAGQTLSGLIIDGIGFGPSGRVRLTPPRLIGALIVLVAVAWSVSGRLAADISLTALILPFVAGLVVGWQQAVNGRIKNASGSTLSATFVNFVVGAFVLVTAMTVRMILDPVALTFPPTPWLYVGGALGCAFIALSSFVVQHTGVLLLGMGTVAGQLLTGVILDLTDIGPEAMGAATLGGAGLALAAALIASLPYRPAGEGLPGARP